MKLEGILSVMSNKSGQKSNMIHGLLYILNQLLVPSRHEQDPVYKATGYLEFDSAYNMYCGFFDVRPKPQTFRDNLLHEDHGLCVLIVSFSAHKR